MTNDLHSFADVALGTGRFEMHASPNQGTQHHKSLVDVDSARARGLFDAHEIRCCMSDDKSVARERIADSLGQRDGKTWLLQPPRDDKQVERWRKLLESEIVVVFRAPSSPEWLAAVIAGLYAPFVGTTPPMSLSRDWLAFEKKTFSTEDNCVHVATGGKRAFFCFVGCGPLFAEAVAFASHKPPLMMGYSASGLRETTRSRRMIFKAGENG